MLAYQYFLKMREVCLRPAKSRECQQQHITQKKIVSNTSYYHRLQCKSITKFLMDTDDSL